MTEIWESSFINNQAMWGFEPADSAVRAKDFFLEKNVREVLIPGVGYGRNAKVFLDNGIDVTGIEISKTAIEMARDNGLDFPVFHGSVTDMPFDDKLYDGIFCYGLIYLLSAPERKKFIKDCYDQLKPGGYMIFTAISKEAPMFGKGKKLAENHFELTEGIRLFFYGAGSIEQEFGDYGLMEISEILEPHHDAEDKPPFPFLMVTCRKEA